MQEKVIVTEGRENYEGGVADGIFSA